MAIYRRARSPFWYVAYTDAGGKRIRKATQTANRKEAAALEAKWKLEAHNQKHWGEAPTRTFDELMLRYLQETASTKRSAPRDVASARHLYAAFTGRDMQAIGVPEVRSYITTRKEAGVTPATINKELGLLSAAINYARKEWGWVLINPAQGRRLKEPEARLRWLTRAEAAALLRAAATIPKANHLADFITLALHTGCRRGEMLGLEWRRVDLQRGLILLESEHTKAGRRRYVPINETARAALLSRARFRATHCPDSQWVFANRAGKRIGSVKHSFTSACKVAGIADFKVHDLRHTCAAWLVSAGIPLPEVRDLLGHRSVTMTEKYAHLEPANVRAAVLCLDGVTQKQHTAPHAVPNMENATA
jgi:integrase